MSKQVRKISYFSVMVLVVAGTIGAGIFFKNRTLNQMAQGHFGIVMATWGVGIFGMLAIALALVEVTSAQKTNKGMLEWTKLFTPAWFHKSSSNYIKWVYGPLTCLTMPLYVVNALEDAGIQLSSEIAVLGLSFIIFMWFMITNLISLKFAEVSQWVTTIIQLAPLLVLPIIGFANAGDIEGTGTILNKGTEASKGLTGASPWLATIAGISAISFAYDGFYAAAAVRNEMKEPQKIGKGLAGGVILISLIYLFITIGFQVAGNGNIYGMQKFMSDPIFKMFNAFVAIGIMGIVNSFIISLPRTYADMTNESDSKELVFTQKLLFGKEFNIKSYKQRFFTGWTFLLVTTTLAFLILGPIGAYGYTKDGYGSEYGGNHSYQFADLLTNFTSLLIFIIISTVLLGAIINRKTKKVDVIKSKAFIPLAITSVIINYLAGGYMFISSIVDATGYNGANSQAGVVEFIVFITILGISILPILFVPIKNKFRKTRT